MGRSNKTLRIEDDVDAWLDEFTEDTEHNRSDVVNRAVKVYAAKTAKGDWEDPKFRDSIDKMVEDMV